MTRFGIHIDPPLAFIPPLLSEAGLDTFQTTLRNPVRLAKEGIPDETDQNAYLVAAWGADLWGMVHGSMITSLGAPDPRIRHGSANALVADANLAQSLGLAGVCFHVGYQKGHTDREAAHAAVAKNLAGLLPKLLPGARVLLENGCEGTELGQTVGEIGEVLKAAEADSKRVGVILDTCHLHVAGFDLAAPGAPERLAEEIEAAGVTPYLVALHLNDAREPCGSKRDRHATPGSGTIGEGLRRLLAHPLFAPLPAILEIGYDAALEGIRYLSASE